jgi:hypothetical protein
MTHFRRYEFKKRRYCSTPAVANLHDFSDNFVEELKVSLRRLNSLRSNSILRRSVAISSYPDFAIPQNKIKLDGQDASRLVGTIPEEDVEEMRLINGIKKLAAASNQLNGEDAENNRPARKQGAKSKQADNGQPLMTNGGANAEAVARLDAEQDSVFKSANWLSDSELIFSLTNQVGGLVRALRVFQELNIGIKHVESRPSKRRESEFEIFVDIDCSDKDKMRKLVHHLR